MIDDVHEPGADEARRQLELLVMRAPPRLRVMFATRHDVRLGLHRLRLVGELTEIRADDLRFTVDEARELLATAGVGLAERGSASVPEGRRGQAQVLLGVVRLLLARQRGNLSVVAEQAQQLQAAAEAPEAAQYDLVPPARAGLGEELRALALVSLGVTEFLAAGFEDVERHLFEDAERHLEQGVALARRIGRPYLELVGLAYQAVTKVIPLILRAGERTGQAIELAERHGWTDEPAAGYAYALRGVALIWQGRPEEAEPWARRAERTLRPEAEPTVALLIHHIRGQLELACGRDADALAAFQAAERLAGRLAAPHLLVPSARALVLYALVRLGETERAEQVLDGLSDQDREHGEIRIAAARFGSPGTTRTRRPPPLGRSWTAPLPRSGGAG